MNVNVRSLISSDAFYARSLAILFLRASTPVWCITATDFKVKDVECEEETRNISAILMPRYLFSRQNQKKVQEVSSERAFKMPHSEVLKKLRLRN